MKLFSLLVPVLLLCASAKADVAAVRREVARIDARKLAFKSYDNSDLSTEGARITIKRDGQGTPRKIVATIYGESGQKEEKVYLQNGLPLFVFSVETRYNVPLGSSTKIRVDLQTETRLYFEKGHLIQKREDENIVPLSASQKRAIERETKATIRAYLTPPKH